MGIRVKPSKDEAESLGRKVHCRICGKEWRSVTGDVIHVSPISICPACIYLEMAHKHALGSGISLQEATGNYLKGMAHSQGRTVSDIWNAADLITV